jgi:hypothetical protein
MRLFSTLALLIAAQTAGACELCAIYNAGSAQGQSESGLLFTIAEQYIPYRNPQFEGEEVSIANPSYVDSSITHFVPGYNVNSWLGVSVNIPLTYLNFRRRDLRYSPTTPQGDPFTEKGTEFGLGDTALIARVTVFQKSKMRYGMFVNLLAGVKFPTGDASRLDEEVAQAKIFQSFLPPGSPHDPLGHSIASVHPHMLALGSGSYDGVFGLTANARWKRWFLNGQIQYYLRTKGEAGFKYGDELIVSGGPGAYVFLGDSWTLSLQLNALYDTMGRDELIGQVSNRTGETAWYMGPFLALTIGEHFSANAGVEVPLRIANNGFQSVADYELGVGLSWRF